MPLVTQTPGWFTALTYVAGCLQIQAGTAAKRLRPRAPPQPSPGLACPRADPRGCWAAPRQGPAPGSSGGGMNKLRTGKWLRSGSDRVGDTRPATRRLRVPRREQIGRKGAERGCQILQGLMVEARHQASLTRREASKSHGRLTWQPKELLSALKPEGDPDRERRRGGHHGSVRGTSASG